MKSIKYNSQVQPLTREELNVIRGGDVYEGLRYLGRLCQRVAGLFENTPELPPATIYK